MDINELLNENPTVKKIWAMTFPNFSFKSTYRILTESYASPLSLMEMVRFICMSMIYALGRRCRWDPIAGGPSRSTNFCVPMELPEWIPLFSAFSSRIQWIAAIPWIYSIDYCSTEIWDIISQANSVFCIQYFQLCVFPRRNNKFTPLKFMTQVKIVPSINYPSGLKLRYHIFIRLEKKPAHLAKIFWTNQTLFVFSHHISIPSGSWHGLGIKKKRSRLIPTWITQLRQENSPESRREF